MFKAEVIIAGWICYFPQSDLQEQRQAEARKNMSRGQRLRIYAIRLMVNLFVLVLLGGCGYLIYTVTSDWMPEVSTILCSHHGDSCDVCAVAACLKIFWCSSGMSVEGYSQSRLGLPAQKLPALNTGC